MDDLYWSTQISQATVSRVRSLLQQSGCSSSLEDVFWLTIPNQYLSPIQQEHWAECGPFILALELDGTTLSLEMLTRATKVLHCSCTGPASPQLQTYAIQWVKGLLADSGA